MTVVHKVILEKYKTSGTGRRSCKLKWITENNPCAHVRNVFGRNETICRKLKDRFSFESLFIISDDGPYILTDYTASTRKEIIRFNLDAISDYTNHGAEGYFDWNPAVANSVISAVYHLKQALKLIYDEIGVGFEFETNILPARM